MALCTDDSGVFATSLSREYALAAAAFGLPNEQLALLAVAAADYAFLEPGESLAWAVLEGAAGTLRARWRETSGGGAVVQTRRQPPPRGRSHAGEKRALRDRMEAAVQLEAVDNSRSPFCLFSDAAGGCAR